MSLESAVASEFPAKTRSRGRRYADDGAVTLLHGDAGRVDAYVQGTDRYRTTIARATDRHGTRLDVACACPAYSDRRDPCKHIWALLVVAGRKGHLTGDRAVADGHAWIAPGPPPKRDAADVDDGEGEDDDGEIGGEDEGDDDEFIATFGHRRITRTARAQISRQMREYWRRRKMESIAARQPAPRPVPPTPGQRFLTTLRAHTNVPPAPAAYRFDHTDLMYVVDVLATMQGSQGLVLALMSRRRLQNGEWSRPKPIGISAEDAAAAPAWDRRILSALIGARPDEPYAWASPGGAAKHRSFRLSIALTHELLPLLARSGRVFVKADDGPGTLHPVGWDDGDPWRFGVDIVPAPKAWRIRGLFRRGTERMDVQDPLLILACGYTFTTRAVARLEVAGGFVPIAAMRAMARETIEIADADGPALAEALARAGVPSTDLPEPLKVSEVRSPPLPRLHVGKDPRGYGERLAATIDFDYDGIVVTGSDGGPTTFDAATRRLVFRDAAAEQTFVRRATEVGVRSTWDPYEQRPSFEISPRTLPQIVRTLVGEGWHVDADGQRYRLATGVRLSVASGIDWFDLDAQVDFGDAAVSLASLVTSPAAGPSSVRLSDGSIGILPEDWMARYAGLVDAAEDVDGRLRFRRTQAALLDALLAEREFDAEVQVDAVFTRARDELASFTAIAPADPPATFTGTLREYQRQGLGWFQFLRRFGFGGCLADDMGLGKTVMVLALLAWRKAEAERLGEPPPASLIVVPRSLVQNWQQEAARFAPGLRLLDHSHHARRVDDLGGRADESAGTNADVVMVTYGTLRRDITALAAHEFEYVVLDEAQATKNARTQTAKATRLLRARHRLALSGTPIENHLGELWSLFEFLNPGVLGRAAAFQRGLSGESGDASGRRRLLARALKPFILRRTKAQVAPELPARTEQTIGCELSTRERALYEGLRQRYRASVLSRVNRAGLAQSKMHILEALLRLRQAACHPGLIDPARGGDPSAKFEALISRLGEVVAEGHKALVFSQFTTLLALLKPALDALKLPYEYLDGRTRDRAARVQRFQDDAAVPLFLISLKAGGVGLNLTAADYVFLLDPWWNPAVEAQAIDRAHRIGQTREVFAYRLIARDTVEEKIIELQQTKRNLADALLGADVVGLRDLRREDLELLLS